MHGYRGPHQNQRIWLAAPFVGGLLGGFLGGALAYPRPQPYPFYPQPFYSYPPFPAYPPYYGTPF
ncbi:hypothetical protein [Niallia oryzisoli]|uniref:hypothetical protein n=1 Tax=Niallia oryzisoli TaxID=1737571 RepID=UPI003736B998